MIFYRPDTLTVTQLTYGAAKKIHLCEVNYIHNIFKEKFSRLFATLDNNQQ